MTGIEGFSKQVIFIPFLLLLYCITLPIDCSSYSNVNICMIIMFAAWKGCAEKRNPERPQSTRRIQTPQLDAEFVPLKAPLARQENIEIPVKNDNLLSLPTTVELKSVNGSTSIEFRDGDVLNGKDTGSRVTKSSRGEPFQETRALDPPSVNNHGCSIDPTCSKYHRSRIISSTKCAACHESSKIGDSESLGSSGEALSEVQEAPLRRPSARDDQIGIVIDSVPEDCLPKRVVKVCCCGLCLGERCRRTRWWLLRCYALQLVEHSFFETFVISLIVISSLLLVSTSRGNLAVQKYIGAI